jgi:DNA polymerase-3 subunit epsilon
VPQCLKARTFDKIFASSIATKLTAVREGRSLPLVLRVVASKWGCPNGIFAWDRVKVEALRALLQSANAKGVAAMLGLMCEDFRSTRDGFPDLMLVGEGNVTFLEVKAEGDVIRRNQLTRLRQLQSNGIRAEIGRVEFRFDPEQDYIVVDIETTGGWASGDRITEIGAVKI